jgi:Fic family protein/DNA-binding XRE family transcriptional regulator
MTTQDKLKIIQKMLSVTQTELATTFAVSFPTLNSWFNGKSTPRAQKLVHIEELYFDVTGQKVISANELDSLKKELKKQSKKYSSVIKEILANPDIRDQFVLKLTYHSNSIEGSTLTEPDTAAILFDNVALPHKSLTEHLEAKNHQTALTYVFECAKNKVVINESFILTLHGMLMNGVMPDAGRYRNHGVRIAGVNLPTANYVSIPKLMQTLMSDLKSQQDLISKVTLIHSTFERIHPFSDGNGRVGRLFMCAMLLSANFAPAVILQQQKQLYYTYLYKAQTKNDQSQLEAFICRAVTFGFTILNRVD